MIKSTLTPKQVELIEDFSDQLSNMNLMRFEKYVAREITEILRSLAKIVDNNENLARFKCFPQTFIVLISN